VRFYLFVNLFICSQLVTTRSPKIAKKKPRNAVQKQRERRLYGKTKPLHMENPKKNTQRTPTTTATSAPRGGGETGVSLEQFKAEVPRDPDDPSFIFSFPAQATPSQVRPWSFIF
jgi:hypothetical protein